MDFCVLPHHLGSDRVRTRKQHRVGPGRICGRLRSRVCLQITDLDPIKYDYSNGFEPRTKSMPDIDMD